MLAARKMGKGAAESASPNDYNLRYSILLHMTNGNEGYTSVMNREGVSGIIRYLYKHEDVKNVHLKGIISNHYRLHETMEQLKGAGLVEIDVQMSPKRMFQYRLTEIGERVAIMLMEIEKIISSGK